jgi:hypothetical protein
MNAWSAAHRGVARRPVLAFMLISLGVGILAAAIPPIVNSEILPFGLPPHGVVMSLGARALLRFWLRPGCWGALVLPTSDVALCVGGSASAGT